MKSYTLFIIVLGLTFNIFKLSAQQTTVFFEDFESGWGSWYADNGLWEVGTPVVAVDTTYSGTQCAGTDLDAMYPLDANTRLVSPFIALPPGHIRIKFWHWFHLASGDWGEVQVSTNGIDWETVTARNFVFPSTAWTQACVDISAYAGQTVRLGFHFFASNNAVGYGWYIDNVSVVEGSESFDNPEDYESGIGDWSADNGLWEVGIPVGGPSPTHSGENCAGTLLHQIYPLEADTRLVSPLIVMSEIAGQQPELYFWHYFVFASGDQGQVEFSIDGGEWQPIQGFGGPYFGVNETWSQAFVPLSSLLNSTFRIGFHFTSSNNAVSIGWFIDDVRIEGATVSIVEPEKTDRASPVIINSISPNPFKNQTSIDFDVYEKTLELKLVIFNTTGQTIRTLADGAFNRGNHTLVWDGCDTHGTKVKPGIYFLNFISPIYKTTEAISVID